MHSNISFGLCYIIIIIRLYNVIVIIGELLLLDSQRHALEVRLVKSVMSIKKIHK